ncbi:hypothetical protein Rsub_05856 [Raphidocelis subcapitata]|uniref:Uncharacterized protein n=1 Tax=Raphidocelis subcapitata TaxID=307507 RepID=A0A2V0P7G4_9CHLO|nr:hypothetical protein Rsub_05856 [Raphidocelis subcapitata]|eukprot:GBF93127.1 hypothetical protein Rsub_05856 [Raphidocelis subcapitata]
MQPQTEPAADAAPTRRGPLKKGARATRKALGNAAAAFGGLFVGKSAPKPAPAQTMELQEMRGASAIGCGHRKSGSESSALTDTSADQSL